MIAKLLWRYYEAKLKWTKFKRMLSIPREHYVIDIGGGDGPFPRADVMCEKYLFDDAERTQSISVDRPVVVGDIEALPFKDKAFDFVYCSHILEHTHNPSQAIREIMRIGKRGYIEVPSEYMETAAKSSPAHLWTVRRGPGGALHFHAKTKGVLDERLNAIYYDTLWQKDPHYMAFYMKNFPLFNIALTWEGDIPHAVDGRGPFAEADGFLKGRIDTPAEIESALASRPKGRGGIRSFIKNIVKNIFRKSNLRPWLDDHLACYRCKGSLLKSPESMLICNACRLSFPVVNGVPLLMKVHARAL